jgi:hypothetical protein
MPRRKGAQLPRAPVTAAAEREGTYLAPTLPVPTTAAAAQPSLAVVPDDVLLLVVAHLSGWELSRCVNVCASWRRALTRAAPLWRAALLRDFADATLPRELVASKQMLPEHVLGDFYEPNWYPHERVCRRLHRERAAGGGPAALRAAQAAAAAAPPAAPAQPPPAAWAFVSVAERWVEPKRRQASIVELRGWLHNVTKPFRLVWTPARPDAATALSRRPRRLRLHAPLQHAGAPGAPEDAYYRLYTALACALLRGRCRVCNCETTQRHPVLRVPMCAVRACGGTFPVVTAAAAAAALGARDGAAAAAALAARGAAVGTRKDAHSHMRRTPRAHAVLLASSVCAAAATITAPLGAHAGAS